LHKTLTDYTSTYFLPRQLHTSHTILW